MSLLNLGEYSLNLFNSCSEIFGISKEQLEEMVLKNDIVYTNFQLENALGIRSIFESFELIQRMLFYRKENDYGYNSIDKIDILYAKSAYNIDLVPLYNEVRCLTSLEVYKIFEKNSGWGTVLSSILEDVARRNGHNT